MNIYHSILTFTVLLIIISFTVKVHIEQYSTDVVPTTFIEIPCERIETCHSLISNNFGKPVDDPLSAYYKSKFTLSELEIMGHMKGGVKQNIHGNNDCVFDRSCFMPVDDLGGYKISTNECMKYGGYSNNNICIFELNNTKDVDNILGFAKNAMTEKNKHQIEAKNALEKQILAARIERKQLQDINQRYLSRRASLNESLSSVDKDLSKLLGTESRYQQDLNKNIQITSVAQNELDRLIQNMRYHITRSTTLHPPGDPVKGIADYNAPTWGTIYFPIVGNASTGPKWIWKDANHQHSVMPGKIYFNRFYFNMRSTVIEGFINIAVDDVGIVHHLTLQNMTSQTVRLPGHNHSWDFYKKQRTRDELDKVRLKINLEPGNNLICVEAENLGQRPNPAGMIFSMDLPEESTTESHRQVLISDHRWSCTTVPPRQNMLTYCEDILKNQTPTTNVTTTTMTFDETQTLSAGYSQQSANTALSTLYQEQVLLPGQEIKSQNNLYTFGITPAGLIFLKKKDKILYKREVQSGSLVKLQQDGNLAVYRADLSYDKEHELIFNRNTKGNYTLTLHNWGNLIIRDGSRALWDIKHALKWLHPVYYDTLEMCNGSAEVPCAYDERLYSVNDMLVSNNKRYKFVMQRDGNAVIYENYKATWSTNTNEKDVFIQVQVDGNMVLYNFKNQPIKATSTHSTNRPFRLVLQDDGNLVLYDKNGFALWASMNRNNGFLMKADKGDMLMSNERLSGGNFLLSQNGIFKFVMHVGGDAGIYENGRLIWKTPINTPTTDSWLVMQQDGNVVIYTKNNNAVLWTGTGRHEHTHLEHALIMKDDGSLLVFDYKNNRVVVNLTDPNGNFLKRVS